MAVEVADGKAEDTDGGHDDGSHEEAVVGLVKQQYDGHEGDARNELSPDGAGLTGRSHLTSFFDIAGHDAGQRRVGDIRKGIDQAPGHVSAVGEEDFAGRGNFRHRKGNNCKNGKNNTGNHHDRAEFAAGADVFTAVDSRTGDGVHEGVENLREGEDPGYGAGRDGADVNPVFC